MAPYSNAANLMNQTMARPQGEIAMTYVYLWIYFNLVGNTILLPIIVITFLFSKTAKRHPTLINLCITWIFSGIFSLLLFYSKQHIGSEPDPSICLAQASLLYGITPMWAVAVLTLVLYMLHTLKGENTQSAPRYLKSLPMIAMLSAPYVAQCSFTLAALLLAYKPQEQEKVRRFNGLYCGYSNPKLYLAMSIFTLVTCLFIIAIEVALAVVIYRNWRTLRSAGLQNDVPLPLIARVLIFGVYVLLGIAVNILDIFHIELPGNIFAATAGTVVFLIFGTQTDVFRAWCFWKKHDQSLQPMPQPSQLSIKTRSLYSASLDGIFRSAKSETNLPWSNRSSRAPSRPSTHRYSTKNFIRLPDDVEQSRQSDLPEWSTQGAHPAEVPPVPEMPEIPEPVITGLRQGSMGEPPPLGGLARLDTTRKRRWDDPPRPKGPRKASISSMRTALSGSTASSGVRAPALAAVRPSDFAPASVESLRTQITGSEIIVTPSR